MGALEVANIVDARITIEKDSGSPTIGQIHSTSADNFYSCLITHFQRLEVVTDAVWIHFVCFLSRIGQGFDCWFIVFDWTRHGSSSPYLCFIGYLYYCVNFSY
jgi:hypothetical protein